MSNIEIPQHLTQYKECGIVYALIDPNTDKIRYVGKSIQGIKRAYEHSRPSSLKEGNTPKNNWIKKLKKNNQIYKVVVLFSIKRDTMTKDELNILVYNKEHEYIDFYKKQDNSLLNLIDGGAGAPGRKSSEKTRQKMSESAKKRDMTYLKFYSYRTKEEKEATKLRQKEKMKSRNRKVPGSRFKFIMNNGQKIIAKDINGNELIGFYALRNAAEFLGGKANKTGIRNAINNKQFYYGYYWEKI